MALRVVDARGEAELEAKARGVRERYGLAGLLVTRSEEGMSLYEDAATPPLHVPAQAREVFDVTGAGDTVIATLVAMLACGLTLRQAVPLAAAAIRSASSPSLASVTVKLS